MLDGMSDSIQGSRIENLQSREVDRQSPMGLIFLTYFYFMNNMAGVREVNKRQKQQQRW